jgi:hypothetical protein
MKMKAAWSSGTSVSHSTTLCHNPKDSDVNILRRVAEHIKNGGISLPTAVVSITMIQFTVLPKVDFLLQGSMWFFCNRCLPYKVDIEDCIHVQCSCGNICQLH